MTLCYRKGYFRQTLDAAGNQFEKPQEWAPEQQLTEANHRVSVEVEGRQVIIRAWKYTITGVNGDIVPVYLLDTDLPENAEQDRGLTDSFTVATSGIGWHRRSCLGSAASGWWRSFIPVSWKPTT